MPTWPSVPRGVKDSFNAERGFEVSGGAVLISCEPALNINILQSERNIQQQLIYIDLSNRRPRSLEYISVTAPIWTLKVSYRSSLKGPETVQSFHHQPGTRARFSTFTRLKSSGWNSEKLFDAPAPSLAGDTEKRYKCIFFFLIFLNFFPASSSRHWPSIGPFLNLFLL